MRISCREKTHHQSSSESQKIAETWKNITNNGGTRKKQYGGWRGGRGWGKGGVVLGVVWGGEGGKRLREESEVNVSEKSKNSSKKRALIESSML